MSELAPWPALMTAATAARYCDESSVQAFRRRVGTVYPAPVVIGRGRQKWLKREIDAALACLRPQAAVPTQDLPSDFDAASVL